MSYLDVPGARLYYETHGSGAPLVMIAGAAGTGGVFGMVAEHLAARYTVVLYDRRGFSRSQLDGPQDYGRRLTTDAEDVCRLIAHVGGGAATVFGSSSGVIVALRALTDHPAVVAMAVPHEPPAVRQLPDGARWLERWRSVYDLYRTSGVEPALARFRAHAFSESDVHVMTHAPKNPANAMYWFEHELRQYPAVELDIQALATYADRIVLVAGRDSGDYPCRQVNATLASKLGRTLVELPGGHLGFVTAPVEFARGLLTALDQDADRAAEHRTLSPWPMRPQEWESWYAATPHWDLGRPQPAMRALAEAGAIRGRVLDVGCGTGEHVLMCAALGLDATGVDIAPAALRAAEDKARTRGLPARFVLGDALRLTELERVYDTVLDCGLFHMVGDADRATYVNSVRGVLAPGGRYLMLCFSDQQPGDQGPRRLTRDGIVTAFADGWRIDSLQRTRLDSQKGPDGIPAWQLTAIRS